MSRHHKQRAPTYSYYSGTYQEDIDTEEAMSKAIEMSQASSRIDVPSVNLKDWAQDEYLFVLDYFNSLGLEYSQSVLKYESQHPEIKLDRKALAKRYGLDYEIRTPLIVQLMSERLNKISE